MFTTRACTIQSLRDIPIFMCCVLYKSSECVLNRYVKAYYMLLAYYELVIGPTVVLKSQGQLFWLHLFLKVRKCIQKCRVFQAKI